MPLWRLRIAHCASQSSLSSTMSKRFWLVQPHTAVRHATTLANCASSTSHTALPPSFNSFTGAAPPLGKNTIDRPAASSLAQGGLVSSPSSHSSQLQQHSFQPFCCRGSHPGGRIMLKKNWPSLSLSLHTPRCTPPPHAPPVITRIPPAPQRCCRRLNSTA